MIGFRRDVTEITVRKSSMEALVTPLLRRCGEREIIDGSVLVLVGGFILEFIRICLLLK